ncbi:phosphoribosylformylglycinamidine synthase subunit PurS [Methanosalsum natronophilum]|uniref:Phosphoribosylformylglycinamidine synthase subunit PurS n=1 Tax=Methanosalsum natronophilum TaxID=768733 RepID=A0A424Z3A7_9EURY|nr:phosphoribosylformylglycinamidine synthase subunit PurS [Methanosalsum natronophilum]MCS3923085.1 phosphoribosylformylglycinamidine synthase [Methanosalsum natronophilum]RQD89029.1 MAG: phosphoribosylformylglycinamidine synthase, purS protein [Methanosalsum natronophilum]
MEYYAEVTVQLKDGMLDPEGSTIKRALEHLGYSPKDVKSAKKFIITIESESIDKAKDTVDEMCRRLIANPVIHDYSIIMREA